MSFGELLLPKLIDLLIIFFFFFAKIDTSSYTEFWEPVTIPEMKKFHGFNDNENPLYNKDD